MYDITKDFASVEKINDFEKASGPGSFPHNNTLYCGELLETLASLDAKRVLDYGCGNLETYKGNINWADTPYDYVGVDLSEMITDKLNELYPTMEFNCVPAFTKSDVLHGDAIIVKDVFIHWYDDQIAWFAENVLPGFKYGIFTHSADLSVRDDGNWKWRPVNHTDHFNVVKNTKLQLDRIKNMSVVSGK